MSGVLNLLLAGAASAIKDAYYNLTTLLLNTSSTNGAQNNTFLDSSTNNFTITRNGNTTQGTFTPFSQTGWSNFFGSSNFLTTPSSSAFNLSSGDWTIEGWFWLNTNSDDTRLFTIVNSSSDMYGAFVRSGTVRFGQIGVGDAAFGTVNLNTWNHIAFSKTSTSTVTCYINGVSTGSTTSYTLPNANCTAYIAASPANFALATTNGYVSNFRIVKGTAVYTSAFTPPTTPLTAITNTSLLTCQSNCFIDNSTNAFTVTPNGTPSVQAFSPFLPTAAYDAAVVGGSAYFDGSGDYLTSASSANLAVGTGDFTYEFWLYPHAANSDNCIFDTRAANNNTSGFAFLIRSSANLEIYTNTANLVCNGAIKQSMWQHVALVRSGSTVTAYVNGVSVGSATFSNNLTDQTLSIASYVGAGSSISAYISGFRLVKGTAVYTATFTPPTSPATAITNTQILLSATNSGIFDSTAKNVLETVGNAQVSTTQAKWGTTSMYFDGSGDSLSLPGTLLNLGSSDFTIEAWIYATTTDRDVVVGSISDATGGGSWMIMFNNSGPVRFFCRYSSGSTLDYNVGSGSFATNAWTHLAVTRNGANLRIFINGTQTGTTNTALGTSSIDNASANYYVGQSTDNGAYFTGYIDDLRITRGYARYVSNFSVPTAAFPLQ